MSLGPPVSLLGASWGALGAPMAFTFSIFWAKNAFSGWKLSSHSNFYQNPSKFYQNFMPWTLKNLWKSLKNHCFFFVFSIFPLSSTNPSRRQFLPSSDLILELLGLNLEVIGFPLPPFGLCWGHLWSSLGCLGVILGALVPLFLSIFVPLGANSENLDPQDPSPSAFLAKNPEF